MYRGDLTDAQWGRLQPLLPPHRRGKGTKGGRPSIDHRRIINGIIWILRTGAPWADLPERYGNYKTVSSRYYRWRHAGLWDRILADLQAEAERDGTLDWTLHFIDSTIVRAHQHAAGAKGGTQKRKHWAAVKVALAPSSASAPKAMASP